MAATAAAWRQKAARLAAGLENPFGFPRNYAIYPILDLLTFRIFHQNFIFLIKKCVPANSEDIFSSLESSPAIYSSNFMNWKMFPLYLSVASGIKFQYLTHQLFLCAPSPTHCSQYLLDTHNFMKTLLMYQGICIVVEVPIQAKMDYDDRELADFQFGSSQESEIEPPVVIDSCLGLSGRNP